jgi:signal transduction histidine kinase
MTASVAGRVLGAPFTRRARAEFGYALVGLPLAVAGFVYTVVTLGVGAYFAIVFAGLVLISASTYGARAFGVLHRRLARRLLDLRIAEPAPFRPAPGVLGWTRSGLTDAVAWRARAYLLLKLPVAVLEAAVAGFLWIVGFYYLTYPLWWALFHRITYQVPGTGRRESVIGVPFPLGHFTITTAPGTAVVAAMGVVALLAAPWATSAAVAVDRWLIGWLLGPTSLTERVRDLERTRAQAIDDSADRLRRIERDLHDGAQARLVALAMKLGLAKEKLRGNRAGRGGPPDVERAYQLVDTAHQAAKEAIHELRDLARGIHPPVLDDGLEAALGALAARSEVPVQLTVDIPRRPSPAIETIAYFCVAELLANVAKHSHARHVTIEAMDVVGVLRIRVSDDGTGGASLAAGTGLRGLADRVRTVDGRLELTSPAGGPTVATFYLPTQP